MLLAYISRRYHRTRVRYHHRIFRGRWVYPVATSNYSIEQFSSDVVSRLRIKFPPQNPVAALNNKPRPAMAVVEAITRLSDRAAEMVTASSQIPATPLRIRSDSSMFFFSCIMFTTLRRCVFVRPKISAGFFNRKKCGYCHHLIPSLFLIDRGNQKVLLMRIDIL